MLSTPYIIAIPTNPMMDVAIPKPDEIFTINAAIASTQNPQNPHLFHLKMAIAHTISNKHNTAETGSDHPGNFNVDLRDFESAI